MNEISKSALGKLPQDYLITEQMEDANGILLRSADLHQTIFPSKLLCIARSGAGVNNIPIDDCTEKGVVVFNTPGANANAVKELAICALFLSSRKIIEGVAWTKQLTGADIETQIEKGKKQFSGPEIEGKTLGVIGLGAIGVTVANAAEALGMRVLGLDPYISVDAAWGLSKNVQKAHGMDFLLAEVDYLTLHIPANKETISLINKTTLEKMKDGVRIINLSRAGLIEEADMQAALASGKVAKYVTDFPTKNNLKWPNTIHIPHLGASTPESEDNCAQMAVAQMQDFLSNGNIRNSVNFPNSHLPGNAENRLTLIHKNQPNMLGQISHILAEANINISNMINNSKGSIAYTMIDVEVPIAEQVLATLSAIEGVKKSRFIQN